MAHDPDDDRPEHLTWDQGVARYEDDTEFLANAIDTLDNTDTDALPDTLRAALIDWYRGTDTYRRVVEYVIDEAAHVR